MKYPTTTNDLRKAGFEYAGERRCSGKTCGASIEWWLTPGGKKIPMSIVPPTNVLFSNQELRQPHFMDCPDVEDFRRSK